MRVLNGFFLMLVFVATTSCATRHFRDTALYHPSGRAKPLVAVLPVINSVGSGDVGWDLSQEMTEEIRKKVSDSSRIFLFKSQANLAQAIALNSADLGKLSTVESQNLSPAEFVVVTELIDQSQHSKGYKNEKRTYLNEVGVKVTVAMRLRVIDLRGKEPRVVLQEVVTQTQDVGKGYLGVDYSKTPWGTVAFANTPLGMAHSKIVREIVSHVEGYIGL